MLGWLFVVGAEVRPVSEKRSQRGNKGGSHFQKSFISYEGWNFLVYEETMHARSLRKRSSVRRENHVVYSYLLSLHYASCGMRTPAQFISAGHRFVEVS